MTGISEFNKFTSNLKEQEEKMPVLFIGHGSPTNGIEENEFSTNWARMGTEIPQPEAVLVISAHWLTRGTRVTAMDFPRTIHDFGGFQQELYEVNYPAPGSPHLAAETVSMIKSTHVDLDQEWGLDHGAWSVVRNMYPDAKVPVVQLSIDYHQGAAYHYNLVKQLSGLRKKGVLIIGSGNMVHNLRLVQFPAGDFSNFNKEFGYDWALEMNEIFKKKITSGDHKALIDYHQLGEAANLAIPTPDHYYPLLYVLGLQEKEDHPVIFNDKVVGGSASMTSVKFQKG